ncbi:unnamed protein product [Linum trigynum]|uniref:Uncharacterized protein n=1 Tax=Linum trigynum TaxID=586398 RepID=A0AAV2EKS9_9ROSI
MTRGVAENTPGACQPGFPLEAPSMLSFIHLSAGGDHPILAQTRCGAWFLLLEIGSGARHARFHNLVRATIKFSREGADSAALVPLKQAVVRFFYKHQEAVIILSTINQ